MALTTESTKTESLTPVHWLAVVLLVITGIIHLYAGVVEGRLPVSLAGVGFLVGVGLFFLDYRRRVLYVIGIFYTGVQIPLWYVANVGEFTPLGYADKAVQIVIIVVLAFLYWRNE
ncbi:MAG: hypothetical protein V5A27_08980 [Halapricum sp.]